MVGSGQGFSAWPGPRVPGAQSSQVRMPVSGPWLRRDLVTEKELSGRRGSCHLALGRATDAARVVLRGGPGALANL